MAKIRAIIKRPDEKYGHCTNISATLANLQRTVGGNIEVVPFSENAVLIVNEDGKALKLEPNFLMFSGAIVGTIVLVGIENGEFTDCPIDFQIWKKLLSKWGN